MPPPSISDAERGNLGVVDPEALRASGSHRALLLAAAALAMAAFVGLAVRYTYPGFDPKLHLAWGRLLASGQIPDFAGTLPAVKHPFYLLLTTAFAPLGPVLATDAYLSLFALACLAVLALVAAIGFRLGGLATAVAATVLTLLSSQIVFLGTIAVIDVPYAALVLGAAWLAALGPRRNAVAVLTLLAIGGLMRPDAWGLAALYALGLLLTRPERRLAVTAIALSAVAPFAWMTMDLALTGNPLDTLQQQEHGSDAGKKMTALYPAATQPGGVEHRRLAWLPGGERVEPVFDAMRFLIGLPLFFLGGLMLLRAAQSVLRQRGPPTSGSRDAFALSLVAVVVAGLAIELVPSVADLPVQPRYMLPVALSLILLAASALPLARHSLVTAIAVTAIAALVAIQLPGEVHVIGANFRVAATQHDQESELSGLVRHLRVERAIARCPRLLASGRPNSFQALMARVIVADRLGRDPDSIVGTYPPHLTSGTSIFILDQTGPSQDLRVPLRGAHDVQATRDGSWLFASAC